MGNLTQKPENNLVWAILSTLFCCLPLGIAAIYYASKVDGLWQNGDYEAAKEAADNAQKYSLWGAILGGAFVVIYILLILLGALAS